MKVQNGNEASGKLAMKLSRASELVDVSVRRLRREIALGRLAALRVSKRTVLVEPSALRAWLERREK
jgi:hypothetical protein